MFRSSIRAYGTGLTIEGYNVRLYYLDRFGLVQTDPFNFVENPELLVLVVAALRSAHSSALGLSPFLHLNDIELHGCKVKFNHVCDPEGQDSQDSALWRFEIDLSEGRSLFTSRKALGRATTVVPVRMLKKGTGKANPVIDETKPRMVWKTAYAHKDYEAEDEIIISVRQSLAAMGKGHILKHVVELVCSMSATVSELNLPRAFLGHTEAPDRIFRSMILVEYLHLSQVNNVAEFRVIYTDVVNGEFSPSSFLMHFH